MLDSTESDNEGDIENIINDSDTEFVAEDESVISTNIIRNKEIGDQSSSESVPEASIHILSTENEDETDSLGQDEPNSAPATQHTSNQPPSPATQRTFSQSPFPANQCTSNQSLAAVVTRRTADQSSKSIYPTVTLGKLDDQIQNEKSQCSIRREQQKTEKRRCPARRRENKEEKKQYDRKWEWKWEDKKSL